MTEEQNEIYQEGYSACHNGVGQERNPYTGMDAEYWSDGWEDCEEDSQ